MVGRTDELRCQQVVTTLRGTESSGGCCIATPTEKNELFDLKRRVEKKCGEFIKLSAAKPRRISKFKGSAMADWSKVNIFFFLKHWFLPDTVVKVHVNVTLSTHIIAHIVLDAAEKLQPSSPLEIGFMSYLYAKCVGQENVIPVWLFFMLMQCSQRETLFLLRVDEGSTILRSFTTEFTCGKQQLKLGVGQDGCNLEVCVWQTKKDGSRRDANPTISLLFMQRLVRYVHHPWPRVCHTLT